MIRLVGPGTVVTVDPGRRVIRDGGVLVKGTHILAIGKFDALAAQHPETLRVDAKGGLILPGLIDAHVHLMEALLRGCGADLPLLPWLRERVWPLEHAYGPHDDVLSARLAMSEMIQAGITTFGESLLSPDHAVDEVISAIRDAGMRAAIGLVADTATRDPLRPVLTARAKWEDDRIHVWVAPRPYTGGETAPLRALAVAGRDAGFRFTWHFANSREGTAALCATHGKSVSAFADDLGLLFDGQLLGHGIWLDPRDIELIAKRGAHLVHLPATNLKLGMGIAPIAELRAAGVNVCVGTDGDNSHDLLAATALAAQIQKGRLVDPSVLPVGTALEMMTIDAARAMGWEADIGSLEVGKKADLIVIGHDSAQATPQLDPLAMLLYGPQGRAVTTVMVDGKLLMQDRVLQTLDASALATAGQEQAKKLASVAGLDGVIGNRWPVS